MSDHLGKKLLYLSRSDVAANGLTMAEIISALERMFREKGEGRVEIRFRGRCCDRYRVSTVHFHAQASLLPSAGNRRPIALWDT